MRLRKLVTCVGLCSLFLSHYASAASDFSETYKNQRGSTLVLVWHADSKNTGTLNGTFTAAVGNCKQDVGIPLPLTGYYNGNAISVTVNFPNCKSVAAITGNLINNKNSIHTIWLLASQAEDPLGKNWDSNLVGTDSYEKVAQ